MLFANLILIIILVALNGFFVAVEFSVVSLRKTRIEILAEEGSRAARIVKSWIEKPSTRDRLIAAAQLGITIVSLALGAVGENTFEALLDPYFHDISLPPALQSMKTVLTALPLVLSLIIVTSLHVVLGEQVPKVASLNSPEKIAMLGARPMQLFNNMFKWFVDVLDWATRMILKLLGLVAVGGHSFVYTVDELKKLVVESEDVGVIESPEREMLHAIFDFRDLLVKHVMIPRTEFIALEVDTTLEDSIIVATQSTFSKFPVYENDLDNIIGIVHIKDLLRARQDDNAKSIHARDLAREAIYVPETASVTALLNHFRSKRRHIAIVVDEFGGTEGLVTLEDVLEEIVGEVSDPFDTILPEIQTLSDGSISIDGLVLIEDVNEELFLDLYDPNYDTIAGYVLGKLGRIPELHDEIEADEIKMRVEEMDGKRIARLSLIRIKGPSPESPAEL